MKLLWTGDHVSFEGKHFRLDDVTLYPKPVQPGGVPVLLGAHHLSGSEVQYRRAARHADGIIGITDSPEQFAQVSERVAELVAVEGRDPDAHERVFYMTVNIGHDERAVAAEADDFLMAYYGVRHWGERWGRGAHRRRWPTAWPPTHQAGAQHLVVRFASWDQRTQFERFEQEVLPAFRSAHGASDAAARRE